MVQLFHIGGVFGEVRVPLDCVRGCQPMEIDRSRDLVCHATGRACHGSTVATGAMSGFHEPSDTVFSRRVLVKAEPF